jgi:hypothetical protein
MPTISFGLSFGHAHNIFWAAAIHTGKQTTYNSHHGRAQQVIFTELLPAGIAVYIRGEPNGVSKEQLLLEQEQGANRIPALCVPSS